MKRLASTVFVSVFVSVFVGTFCLPGASARADDYRIDHLEPPFWWTGMHQGQLQLMVHGPAIADAEPSIAYPGVTLASVTRVANRNYVFINLTVGADAKPGAFDIAFKNGAKAAHYNYRLLARASGSAARAGFSGADAIYQIMPDRFANGNSANDSVATMAEKAERGNGDGRHGGDIAGVIAHLDYIAALGFTQLWPTPLVENNMPDYSYHGYAATNHYLIDARYGSNEDYQRLSAEARKKGIGLIADVVLSHIGAKHWWMKDLPTPDWVNHADKFVPTRHHRVSVQDPYGAVEDKENFTTGWFSDAMPDLNQTNPLVANYLIQNNIWWIEYAGLSGLRVDTFGYSDSAFLTTYTRRLMDEYPNLNMVGEEWHNAPAVVSHWQKGKVNFDGYVSSMPSMMDFPMSEAMRSALAEGDEGWGLNDVYEKLSLDYLYPNAANLVLFEGNHDMPRIFSVLGESVERLKMELVFLMTMPRIPQFYYGTEILMTSATGPRNDASYRRDMPGGWAGDKVDAFTGAGLTEQQRAAQAFVKRLVNWRKATPVIHHGKMMHYGAEDGSYVYFRYDDTKTVMVAFNKSAKAAVLPTARFRERLKGAPSGLDVLSGKRFDLRTELNLPARSVVILEL